LCNSCASLAGLVLCFIACFVLLVIAPLLRWSNERSTNRVDFCCTRERDPTATNVVVVVVGVLNVLAVIRFSKN